MSLTARTARTALTLALTLMLSPAAGLAAQEEPTVVDVAAEATAAEAPAVDVAVEPAAAAPPARDAATPAADEPARDSGAIRNDFSSVLRQHPPELARILVLDPTLLSNDAFLAGYPKLTRFVAANPEVRRTPGFYLAQFRSEPRGGALDEVFEALIIFATFLLIALALAWLLRTIIEQKRWSRLSRTQSEVHNKILDRFGTSEELLAYVRTPAGTRFLESAPIPLHADRPQGAPQSAPLTRVLWSIQIGVVVAVGALGMLLVSIPFDGDGAQALFVLGAIGFCVGAGFIASAAVSLFLSRRLGLWEPPGSGGTAPAARLETEPVE
jgi:hypothetical protein